MSDSKLTQQTKVLNLFKKYGKYGVPNYAFYQNNILSPHRRMFELKEDGYGVTKEKEISNGKFYGVYRYFLSTPKKRKLFGLISL
jgi:hypothetical protein